MLVLRPLFRIVHWNMGGLHCCWGMPLAAHLGFSNVFLVPGCGYARELAAEPRGRKLLAALLRYARRVVILNSAMEVELLSLGFARDRLVTLPCEADPNVFRPVTPAERRLLRAQWGVPEDGRVVVFTGRLIETKRVPDLIHAMAALRRRDPLALLLIAGDGDQSGQLRILAEQLGLGDAARFAGQLSASGVAQALQLADLLVLPSEIEGIPCSVVEALAVALPVVVSHIPGTEFVIHDVHGLRAPVGDVPALEAAMAALLERPERRRRMGEAGRQLFLERYTTGAVAGGYQDVYRLAVTEQ